MKRAALTDLAPRYDLIVIGGGITGAGILLEAARTGASVLLVEKNDFASGTSSGSSKLVHGGLRYLKTGQWKLTLESVRERQRLLAEAYGLVETQPFMMPIYQDTKPGKNAIRLGLWLYDRMAGASTSRWVDADEAQALEPKIRRDGLLGAMLYDDARTNDARLVMQLIVEACTAGASARNYTRVMTLLTTEGRVCGVSLKDEGGAVREVRAGVVVDATGVSAGRLQLDTSAPKLRPLRGSHFIFARDRLPVARAVSWLHPRDGRPVFAYPWEGVTLYGTTDLDHDAPPDAPPRMSREESDYLIDGLAHQFPELKLTPKDALSSYSAVRPVVAGGKADPSAESRESAMWTAPGLVGVTGGKLTTFRVTARQVLTAAARQQPNLMPGAEAPLLSRPMLSLRSEAQLRYSARNEQVVHLDDLMLRRTRLGLTTPAGGRTRLAQIQKVCQQELGWTEERWREEEKRYLALWAENHSPEVAA